MSGILTKPDAVSFLIQPPEALRDAPIEQIRRAIYAERDKILNQIVATIHREFTSEVRQIGSIQDAVAANEMDAAIQHRQRLNDLNLPH